MPGPFFWFVVVVGLATVGVAIVFAIRPAERTLALLRMRDAADWRFPDQQSNAHQAITMRPAGAMILKSRRVLG